MKRVTKIKLNVKPKKGASAESTKPGDYIFAVSYVLYACFFKATECKIVSTVKRTCKVFVDIDNGSKANLWRIRELNDPKNHKRKCKPEDTLYLMTLTFQIAVVHYEKLNEYHRVLPDFMCPYWVASVVFIVARATGRWDGKIIDEDLKEEYVCVSKSRRRARNLLMKIQDYFIDKYSGTKEISNDALYKCYVVDIFKKDCYYDSYGRLRFDSDAKKNWSVKSRAAETVSMMLYRLPRFIRN